MKNNKKGFSLVELMVVVVVVGILAAVTTPAYINYIRRARIAEAKANLGSIKLAQESYRAPIRQAVTLEPGPPTPALQQLILPLPVRYISSTQSLPPAVPLLPPPQSAT